MARLTTLEALQAARIIFPENAITAATVSDDIDYIENLLIEIGWATQALSWTEFALRLAYSPPPATAVALLRKLLIKVAVKVAKDKLKSGQNLDKLKRGELSGTAILVVRWKQRSIGYLRLDENAPEI